MQKQEEKIYSRMLKGKDSLLANTKISEVREKYAALKNKLKSPLSPGELETFHLFGLSDRYTENGKDINGNRAPVRVHPGFDGDIMGSATPCINQVHFNNWGNFILKSGKKSGDILNSVVDKTPDGKLKL